MLSKRLKKCYNCRCTSDSKGRDSHSDYDPILLTLDLGWAAEGLDQLADMEERKGYVPYSQSEMHEFPDNRKMNGEMTLCDHKRIYEEIGEIIKGIGIERTSRGSLVADMGKTYQYAKALSQIEDVITGGRHRHLD